MQEILKFESKNEALAPQEVYISRLKTNIAAGFLVLFFFLGIGVLGYRLTCGYEWIDALLNASMILGGMGPITPDNGAPMPFGGKVFASVYALISGIVLISTIGLIIAPLVHRLFHRFHIEDTDKE